MKLLNQFVDWLVLAFGGGKFIAIYNSATLIWYIEGRYNPHWFDPFPSNFYTFVVSWLAINMTSFVLRSDLRKRAEEERQREREIEQEKRDRERTEAILHVSQATQKLIEYLVEFETGVECAKDVNK